MAMRSISFPSSDHALFLLLFNGYLLYSWFTENEDDFFLTVVVVEILNEKKKMEERTSLINFETYSLFFLLSISS